MMPTEEAIKYIYTLYKRANLVALLHQGGHAHKVLYFPTTDAAALT